MYSLAAGTTAGTRRANAPPPDIRLGMTKLKIKACGVSLRPHLERAEQKSRSRDFFPRYGYFVLTAGRHLRLPAASLLLA